MPSVAGGCLAHKLPKSACDRSLWIAIFNMVHRLTIVPCTEKSDQDACNELLFSLTISYGVSHTAIHKALVYLSMICHRLYVSRSSLVGMGLL